MVEQAVAESRAAEARASLLTPARIVFPLAFRRGLG